MLACLEQQSSTDSGNNTSNTDVGNLASGSLGGGRSLVGLVGSVRNVSGRSGGDSGQSENNGLELHFEVDGEEKKTDRREMGVLLYGVGEDRTAPTATGLLGDGCTAFRGPTVPCAG